MIFEEAVTSIILFLSNKCRGVDFRHFYIGKTNDIETCLFEQHNVFKEKGLYTTVCVDTPEIAEAVVQHFRALGMDGNFENVDINATVVYCYLITEYTKEIL